MKRWLIIFSVPKLPKRNSRGWRCITRNCYFLHPSFFRENAFVLLSTITLNQSTRENADDNVSIRSEVRTEFDTASHKTNASLRTHGVVLNACTKPVIRTAGIVRATRKRTVRVSIESKVVGVPYRNHSRKVLK